MKLRATSLLALCGLLAVSSVRAGDAPPAAIAPAPGLTKSQLAPPYSGSIGEVVKLSQSGVEDSVVLAFVKNSPQAFNPSADEIIKLRDAGISSEVLTAMLQRGGELRQQSVAAMAAAGAAPQAYPPAMQPPQSGAGYSSEAAPYYSAPAESAPSTVYYLSSGYGGYSYPYSYSYYYPGYSYVYSGYYYPYYYPYCYPYGYWHNGHNHSWAGHWNGSTPYARYHPQSTFSAGFSNGRTSFSGAARFNNSGVAHVNTTPVMRSGGGMPGATHFSGGGGTRTMQGGGRTGGFRR